MNILSTVKIGWIYLFAIGFSFFKCRGTESRIVNEQWFKTGEPFSICSSLEATGTDAVMLYFGNIRLSTIYQGKIYKSDISTFNRERNWKGVIKNGKLCLQNLNNAIIEQDDGLLFTFQLASDRGFGSSLDNESINVKLYTPIEIMPSTQSELLVQANGAAVLECATRGYPNLEIVWKEKDSGKIVKSLNASNASQYNGKDTITLNYTLDRVPVSLHGKAFVCEAKTSYKDQGKQVVTEKQISVLLEPKITVDEIIYTDLGEIKVSGYPRPRLACPGLTMSSAQLSSLLPRGGTYSYRLKDDSVTKTHTRKFSCKAENAIKQVTAQFSFTDAPSPAVIVSPTTSNYSDYHLFNWKVNSTGPLENVTIFLKPVADAKKMDATNLEITLKFPLQEDKVEKLKTSMWPRKSSKPNDDELALTIIHDTDVAKPPQPVQQPPQGNESNERRVWHHLTQLTGNTSYDVDMNVCNQHACSKLSRDSSKTFRTADSENNVSPKVLKSPPMAVSPAAAGENRAFRLSTTEIMLLQVPVLLLSKAILF